MNISIHASFGISILFFGYIRRNGIAGPYGGSLFRFLRRLHSVFHSCHTDLHSYQPCTQGFPFLYTLTNMLFVFFLMIAILTGVSLYFIVVLICIFWMVSDVEYLFNVPPGHLYLRNLYMGQEATVRTGHGTTDWLQIGKGVHQGCILSPRLFNLYAEYIMRNARLDKAQAGIKIAGRNINNLRYADDTTLMAESEEELKSLLMKVKEENEKVGLKLNIQKTKLMASGPITSWQIDGETMEIVADFILGDTKITADGDCSHEIKRCLLLGRKSYDQPRQHIKKQRHYVANKGCLVKATIFPVVMYGCDSWTIKKA